MSLGLEAIILYNIAMVELLLFSALIAAIIVYFLRRSKKLKEMELEERLEDLLR